MGLGNAMQNFRLYFENVQWNLNWKKKNNYPYWSTINNDLAYYRLISNIAYPQQALVWLDA